MGNHLESRNAAERIEVKKEFSPDSRFLPSVSCQGLTPILSLLKKAIPIVPSRASLQVNSVPLLATRVKG